MRPKFTVGVSFHNEALHLGLAINSLLRQSFEDWEAILVDDGSTDHSVDIARSFRDSRIRVLSDGRQRGANIRRAQAVTLAAAPFFALMDADDVMHPERLAKQYDRLSSTPEPLVLGSSAYSIDQECRVIGVRRLSASPVRGTKELRALLNPTVSAPTSWFRDNPWSRNPLFWRCQDAELWARTAAHAQFGNLSEALLFYREPMTIGGEEQIGTCLANLSLGIHPDSPLRSISTIGGQVARLIVSGICETYGGSRHVLRLRYSRLSNAERLAAQSILDAIRSSCPTFPIAAGSKAGAT